MSYFVGLWPSKVRHFFWDTVYNAPCLTSVAPSPGHVAHVTNLVKGLVVSKIFVFLYLYVLLLRNTQLDFNL